MAWPGERREGLGFQFGWNRSRFRFGIWVRPRAPDLGYTGRQMLRLVLGFIFLLAATPPASANYALGTIAYERGDYAAAYENWRPLADRGSPAAQFNIGHLYHQGLGVAQDLDAAREWYLKAASQGDSNAQYELGAMHAQGDGVPRDYAAAIDWYRQAAEAGHSKASMKLGNLYRDGRGVPQDDEKAAHWIVKAADQGEKSAQIAASVIFSEGLGVPKDLVEAYMWASIAASRGEIFAHAFVRAIERRMTPAQIQEGRERAKTWSPRLY